MGAYQRACCFKPNDAHSALVFFFLGVSLITWQIWLILDGRIGISSKDKYGTVHHAGELNEGQVSFEWNVVLV